MKYAIKGIFGRARGNSTSVVTTLKKVESVRSRELGKKYTYVSTVRSSLTTLDILKSIFENIQGKNTAQIYSLTVSVPCEKPFECPNCHERFARNSTLKCHLTACQTGVGAKKGRKKLYECQVCNSVFNSWDQFKDHLVIHTGDKPNHCTLCDLWFMQGNELRRHLSDTHNISERLVTEEVLSVETRVQTEPVTSMTIIEQVGKVHVLPLLQVQVDSAQVTVEQVHPDLLQDSQVHESHMSELPEQVQVSYLEVGRIQTEEGTEVHVEELHVERVNQMPVEVQTELLEADLDQVTPEIMNQEERDPTQADAAEAATEEHEDAEALETKSTVDSQAEKAGNENRTPMPVLE